jgi:hypothetical protein
MTFHLKVWIGVWLFIGLLWALAILAFLGLRTIDEDLDGIPVLLDKVKHEIEWMRL